MFKTIQQFKAGDVVKAHGAMFRILDDAHESNGHRPMAAHLKTAYGPSDCAVAIGVCVGGQETSGYIAHGKNWTFQGSQYAGRFEVL